jgi:hypothetical protein
MSDQGSRIPASTPKPQQISLNDLRSKVMNGTIKIPKFQREFVWSKAQAAKLLDSIIKGYPVGTFVLWKTRERLREVREIGDLPLPATPDGDYVNYVLDGQQRMTSLVASLEGARVKRHPGETDFSDLWIDLAPGDGDWVVIEHDTSRPTDHIRFHELYEGNFRKLMTYPEHHHGLLSQLSSRLKEYQFSMIAVEDAPIDVATEIFTRINVTGRRLTLFEIMVAKTYNEQRGFDLADRMEEFLDELKASNYGTVAPNTVLQLITGLLARECTAKATLNLDRERFIDAWEPALDAIRLTVDHFRLRYRIPVSQLLPYNALVVPFGYFFYHHGDGPLPPQQATLLEDFFWRASLGARYSATVEQKLGQDLRRIRQIADGQSPEYDWGIDLTNDFILQNGYFRATRSYVKALLAVLAFHRPQSFQDNALVTISNEWLKKANSKNYHHIFPKAFLRKRGVPDERINHVANIAFVDDYLNKRVIRDRAPSDYFGEFRGQNPALETTLASSHLIGPDAGLLRDDYDAFLDDRISRLRDWLTQRLIPTRADALGQGLNLEDDDPTEEQEDPTDPS